MERASGVLLPIFSLPSKYGIGCFSKEAYQFIDRLKAAGQSYWQILPLGPTGFFSGGGTAILAGIAGMPYRIWRFSVSVFFYICRQSVFYRS